MLNGRTKILLIILIPLMAVLLVLYYLISAVYVPEKEPVVYPTGSLESSIFVEQNNTYTENELLGQSYELKKVPYRVDLPEGKAAVVGDNAIAQQVRDSGSVLLYISEYTDTIDVKQMILSQFPAAMLISYIPEKTKSLLQVDKHGYINGFTAEYLAMSIEVTDNTHIEDAVLLGYAMEVPGVEYAGRRIFVGIGTTEINSENLDSCMQALDAVIATLRKDDKLEEERGITADRITYDSQELRVDTSEADVQASSDNSVVANDKITSVPIDIDVPYKNLVVDVEWTENNPNVVLELFTPDGNNYYSPSAQDGYTAKFMVNNAEYGTWQLRILDYLNCGNVSTFYSGDPISGTPDVGSTDSDTTADTNISAGSGGVLDENVLPDNTGGFVDEN